MELDHAQLRLLFENVLDAILVTDDEGYYVDANPAACELFGLPRDELLQRRITDFMLPGFDFSAAWAIFQQQGRVKDELPIVRADGTIRQVEYAATANFAPHHHLSVLRDVTERWQLAQEVQRLNQDLEQQVIQRTAELTAEVERRTQSEQALSHQKEQLNRLLDALPGCIAYVDRDHGYRYVNQTHQLWFNLNPDAMLGQSLREVWGTEGYAQIQPYMDRVLAGETVTYEATLADPQGNQRHIQATLVPDFDPQAQVLGCYALVLDLSDRKQLELALKRSQTELSEVLDRAIAGILRLRLYPDMFMQVDYVSPQYERIWGLTAEELRANIHCWRSRVHPPDWTTVVLPNIQRILAQWGNLSYEMEYRMQRPLGGLGWILAVCYTQWKEQGGYWDITIVDMDITDRKAAELALHRREEEFRALAENSPDIIIRCDRQFRFLYINPSATQLTGIPQAAFLGKTAQELGQEFGFPESLVSLWHKAVERVLTTGQEQSLEFDFTPIQGTQRTYQARIVPELGVDGSVVSVLAIDRDITDLKRARDALLHQAEREYTLRLITRHIRATLDLDAILSTTVMEVQRTLNADRALIFQLTSDHAGVVIQEAVRPEYPVTLTMHWEDECFPPECYAAYQQGQARIVSNVALDSWGDCLVEFMQQTQVRSKMVAPITQVMAEGEMRIWGLLITHACSEPRQWQAEELDLLQQMAEQLAIAIQQSELYHQVQQLNTNLEQQVYDRTTDLQQALDFEKVLKRITDQVRDSLDEGHILETAVRELGKGLGVVCCDTGIYNADLTTSTITHEFTQSSTSAKGSTFEIANATHQEIYPFLFQGQSLQFCDLFPCAFRPIQGQLTVLACPIMDDQRILGDMWLYKSTDFSVSEVRLVQQVANQCAIALRQSRLYQAAQAQVQELEHLNQLKDDFLSTVSHELRTPMANIKMALQMLEIVLKPTGILADASQIASKYFQILKTECQREIQLINDLLDLTHLDAGTEPTDFTLVDLRLLIPHMAESFIERTCEQQQHLSLIIPDLLPLFTTELPYLERIVTELLNNACKYTPINERIQVEISNTAEHVILAISNSGIEISAQDCDRIFDKFYRIPNNDPWKHGGTGLGLALVKKMVERLKGTITVQSSSQKILTFTLQFPINLAAPASRYSQHTC